MLYNIPRAQLLLPAGPALANDGAVAARPGGCQFAGIRLLHLQLHLLLCATRQPSRWRVLHALGGPRRAAGSALSQQSRQSPGCRSRAALEEGLQARQQICIRIIDCTVSWQRRRCADSAVASRYQGCQFAGIWLLCLQLHLLLCSTRKPWRVLHAMGSPRRAAGSAEWPIAQLTPACSGGGRAAGTKADSYSHPTLRCLMAAAALRRQRSAGSDKNLVGRRLHKQGKLASISEL